MRTVRIALLAAAVLALAAVPALAHAPVKERTPKRPRATTSVDGQPLSADCGETCGRGGCCVLWGGASRGKCDDGEMQRRHPVVARGGAC